MRTVQACRSAERSRPLPTRQSTLLPFRSVASRSLRQSRIRRAGPGRSRPRLPRRPGFRSGRHGAEEHGGRPGRLQREAEARLSGREHGYHGVRSGGISAGGIVRNHQFFGGLLSGSDHRPHSFDRGKQAVTKGESEYGARFARLSASSRFDRRDRFRAIGGVGRHAAAPEATSYACERLRQARVLPGAGERHTHPRRSLL